VTNGYDTVYEPTSQTIGREIRRAERLEIITEVGDIRASRYERDALDGWVNSRYWLAVDDIGAIEPNEWVREAIYHLANERRGKGSPTIWTSNLSPQKLRDTFGAAIASRILGGAVIETDGKDRRVSE
jgi:DNA replication protein DnaC